MAEQYLHNIQQTQEGRNLLYKTILKSNGYRKFFGDDFSLEQLDSKLKYLNKD